MNNAQVRTHRNTGEWAPPWMLNKPRWIRSFYNVKCMSHSEMAKKDTWETSRHSISIFILNTQPISKPTCVTSFYWHKTILFLHSCAALILCGSSPWLLYMQEYIRLEKKKTTTTATTTAWLPYISAQTWTHFDSSVSVRAFVFTESSFEGMMRFRSG